MTDVEAIWEALRQRIADGAEGFAVVTRNPQQQWAKEQFPLLLIQESAETPNDVDGLPPLWEAAGELLIVALYGAESAWTTINRLTRTVREALERVPTDRETGAYRGGGQHWTDLGGLVNSLSVGRVEKSIQQATGEVRASIGISFTYY